MNTLDLPPRRPLPRETRDRLRRSVDVGIAAPPRRSRAPLAAAAAVAVLALGAVVVARWAPDDQQNRPPAATTTPRDDGVVQPVTTVLPDIRTHQDLDHCGEVAEASARAGEFAPRSAWRPKFTATAPDGARVTAFLGNGGKPSFCEVTATTATVSDPTADWTPVATTPDGVKPANVFAVYLSPTGVLAGVGTGMDALEFSLLRETGIEPVGAPAFRDGMFVVNLGDLASGDRVDVFGRNSQGLLVVDGALLYDPTAVPPAGASGPVR